MNQAFSDSATSPEIHHPVLAALINGDMPSPKEIESILSDHQFPLTEPDWSTFVWHGDADSVQLLRWIHGSVERSQFTRAPKSRLWFLRLPVVNGGRFEYKLSVKKRDYEQWVIDPYNPRTAIDPYGENSVCRTFGYVQPEWTMPRGAPIGQIARISIESTVFSETRIEQVYLPASYQTSEKYPLVIIHDGQDFMTYADLTTSLDNLIHRGEIPAIVVALVQTQDRLDEYPRARRHARYLVQDLLPALESRYPLSTRIQDRILVGASLGAVASLSSVFRYPGTFGGLLLQSGSFILDSRKLEGRPNPVFHRVARVLKAIMRAPDLPPTRAFVSTGELEGLADENQELAQLLENRGVEVMFQSAWDGHHWHNWRDQLRDGLIWVLQSSERPARENEDFIPS